MNKRQISDFLFDLNIEHFKINDNFVVDIHESISLQGMKLTKLPFKFGGISGYFDCSDNKLTTLKGCPKLIDGFFDCSSNKLISLKHGPIEVGSFYNCYHNKLTDLSHLPKVIEESIDFRFNDLTSNTFLSNIKGEIYTSIKDNNVKLDNLGRVLNKDVFVKLNKRSSIIKEILRNKKVI